MPQKFPRSRRLTHDLEYQAVYGARAKKTLGPLTAFAIPNSKSHPRLGLSIRRFDLAVTRNTIKRLLREAFRLSQDDLPRCESGSYDLVITARDHVPLDLSDYQRLLKDLAAQLDKEWKKRGTR